SISSDSLISNLFSIESIKTIFLHITKEESLRSVKLYKKDMPLMDLSQVPRAVAIPTSWQGV
ncbi:hypothetical protein, partial [Bartonella sp. AP57NXGY]|uniref:hypothetical protein n=1 Tax=Bartonella sp. AP57NXGY TaxID=3243497 RepID=UPI0035CFE25D